MIALPIVERELIVRARQGRTRWACVGVAAVAVLFTLQFFLLWRSMPSFGLAQQAGYAFQTLAWMGFLLASASCLLTVDCVSSERREGTLGLLFLTRLRFVEVLLGKLAAHGLGAVYGLIALAPALMLPVLAGGVTWRQVVQTALSLMSMLLFSLALGIWASSGAGSVKHSLKRATIWFAILVVLPTVLAAMQVRTGANSMASVVAALSPASGFVKAATATTGLAGASWALLLCGPVYAVLFLVLSASALRSNWREELPADETSGIPVRDPVPAAKPFVGEDPIEWLVCRDRTQTKVLWTAAALTLIGPLFYLLLIVGSVGVPVIGVFSAAQLLANVGSAALFASVGARFMLHARKEGALELLRTTPAGATGLLASHWRVLRNRLAAPLAVMVIVEGIQRGSFLFLPSRSMGVTSMVQLVSSVLFTVLGTLALCWLGIWFGLRSRNLLSAVLWPAALVPGLDMVMRYGFYILLGLVSNGGFSYSGSSPVAAFLLRILLPAGICAKQLLLILWARRRSQDSEMGWSAEPYGGRDSWREFFGWIAAGVRKARHWTPGGTAS